MRAKTLETQMNADEAQMNAEKRSRVIDKHFATSRVRPLQSPCLALLRSSALHLRSSAFPVVTRALRGDI
jgi:hypothetical protein